MARINKGAIFKPIEAHNYDTTLKTRRIVPGRRREPSTVVKDAEKARFACRSFTVAVRYGWTGDGTRGSRRAKTPALRQQFSGKLAITLHIGQAHVTALIEIAQLAMIDAHQTKNC